MTTNRLTEDQWAEVRTRWEGDRRGGFAWLAAEIYSLHGIQITRQGLRKASLSQGWCKTDAAVAAAEAAQRKVMPPMEGPTVIRLDPKLMRPAPRARSNAEGVARDAVRGRSKYRPEYARRIVEHFRFGPCEYVEVSAGGGATRIELRPN